MANFFFISSFCRFLYLFLCKEILVPSRHVCGVGHLEKEKAVLEQFGKSTKSKKWKRTKIDKDHLPDLHRFLKALRGGRQSQLKPYLIGSWVRSFLQLHFLHFFIQPTFYFDVLNSPQLVLCLTSFLLAILIPRVLFLHQPCAHPLFLFLYLEPLSLHQELLNWPNHSDLKV